MEEASHQTVAFQDLPSEVIINCLKYLDIYDLMDCRLLSHQFNNLILNSKELMRTLKFIIQSTDKSIRSNSEKLILEQKFMENNLKDLRDLLEANGHRIRKIEFKSILINYFMGLLPNLEELTIDEGLTYFRTLSEVEEESADLPKIESLMIFNNLKELTIEITMKPDFEVLTDFVAQQPNLKHLSMKFEGSLTKIDFPTSDITSKVKFQLKSFEFHTAGKHNESQHFQKFFESQAEFLDSLSIDFNPDEDLGEIIIKNCTNLKTFSLFTYLEDENPIFTGFRAHWKLSSVTTLISKVMINYKFSSIAARFPNLSKLKCEYMCIGRGRFESIKEIEVNIFDCEKMQNCVFPNLERLEIKMLHGKDVNHWMSFFPKLRSLESLIITDTNFKEIDFRSLCYCFKTMSELMNLSYWSFKDKEMIKHWEVSKYGRYRDYDLNFNDYDNIRDIPSVNWRF